MQTDVFMWTDSHYQTMKYIKREDNKMTYSGTCGLNLNWMLKDGTLTISGTGEMYDFKGGPWEDRDLAPWHDYDIIRVEIQYGVTSIGEGAFYNCTHLTSIKIPDSVTIIFENAFFGCSSLMSITFPAGVEVLCSAFNGCSELIRFNVEDGNENYSGMEGVLFSIDKRRLIQCPPGYPGNYTIPEGVTEIDDYAFEECSKLVSVTFPASVKKIGENVFYGCSANLIIRAANRSYAEDWYNKRKKEVKWDTHMEPSVKDGKLRMIEVETRSNNGRFGTDMFGRRTGLSNAEIGIGHNAHTSINFFNRQEYSIKCIFQHMGDSDCQSYEEIRQNKDGTDQLLRYMHSLYTDFEWIDIDQSLGGRGIRMQLLQNRLLGDLRKDQTIVRNGITWGRIDSYPWLIEYEGTEGDLDVLTEYQSLVKEGFLKNRVCDWVNIAPLAFCGCWTLETVRLPEKVASIQEYAFENCISLKAVYLFSVQNDGISPDAFEGCPDDLTFFLETKGSHKTVVEYAEKQGYHISFTMDDSR